MNVPENIYLINFLDFSSMFYLFCIILSKMSLYSSVTAQMFVLRCGSLEIF